MRRIGGFPGDVVRRVWGYESVASVNGLAGSGTTGGDAGPARGRRPKHEAAASGGTRPQEPAQGHAQEPAQGHAQEMVADSGPDAMVILGKDPGMTTTASKPARPARVADRLPSAPAKADGAPLAAARDDLFARYTRDYVTERFGQQVIILHAGCTTAGTDLAADALRAEGADISIGLVDDDLPVTSAAVGRHESLRGCVQGDLRTVPLPPRSKDIVLCALLLHRIKHAELVLDRLVAAIKPGGLLLLRFRDRDSAAGFLDRVLPHALRAVIWRRRQPGEPGPYPAVYERLTSARGVQAYALMRGLVIAERRALGGLAGALSGPPGFLAVQKLVARLSGGRLTDAHEELLYVLRKPENRFARVL
jgi:SAM-dependent methyltransferase